MKKLSASVKEKERKEKYQERKEQENKGKEKIRNKEGAREEEQFQKRR